MTKMNEFDVIKDFVTKDKETFELAEMVVKNFVGIKDAMAAERLTGLAKDLEKEIDGFAQDWIVRTDLNNVTGKAWRDVLMIGKRCWFQQDYHLHIFLAFQEKDCGGCYIGVCGNFKYVDDPFNKLKLDGLTLVQNFSGAKNVAGFQFGKIPGTNESVVYYVFEEYAKDELYKNLFFYGEYDGISKNIIGRITELIRILEIENNELLSRTNEALAGIQ